MKIGLYIGRFQGITEVHKYIFDLMSFKYDTSYICIIDGKKTSNDKKLNPFTLSIRLRLINKVLNYNNIVIMSNSGYIPDIIKPFEDNEIDFYCGEDRIESYKKQQKYLKTKLNFININKLNKFKRNDISATMLREALNTGDKTRYIRLCPIELWDDFENLRKEII